MQRAVNWTLDDTTALVTIDCPDARVNTLDATLLDELESVAGELATAAGVSAVVVSSSKPGGFIAGADINLIEAVTDRGDAEAMARRGQQVFQLWAELPFPVVAAIHGHCLGGGLEFALACSARIGTDQVQMGLPEVKLGILPGFGGTQRLPRLIGLERAIDAILAGRTYNSEKARRIGLLDQLATEAGLIAEAIQLASAGAPRRHPQGGLRSWLLEKNPLGRSLLFKKARESVIKRTGGHYPAPLRALDVLARTCTLPMDKGQELEARALGELAVTGESKNLIHIYQLSQRAKRVPGSAAPAAEINRAAVLGAGTMGAGIAWLLARKGLQVTLKDINEEAIAGGMEKIRGWASGSRKADEADAVTRIEGTTAEDKLSSAEIVIEAVVEKMAVKQQVIRDTEQYLAHEAIFASNTSSLSITEMQAAAAHPQRVVGLHFFNPVERMPLVEIIRGRQSCDEAIATTFKLANSLGKTPILVADSPGFLVNRLLVAYLNEACLLVEEGVDWQSIDKLALEFGMPMGPFRLVDEVGIDIAQEVGTILCDAFDYLVESSLLQGIVEAGFLGRKNGRGFYRYDEAHKSQANPEIERYLPPGDRRATPNDWQRLIMLMVAEASRCLEQGVIAEAADIDTGMVFGTGFPPFRGGLCRWADQLPIEERRKAVTWLAEQHGRRFEFSEEYRRSLVFYADES